MSGEHYANGWAEEMTALAERAAKRTVGELGWTLLCVSGT